MDKCKDCAEAAAKMDWLAEAFTVLCEKVEEVLNTNGKHIAAFKESYNPVDPK